MSTATVSTPPKRRNKERETEAEQYSILNRLDGIIKLCRDAQNVPLTPHGRRKQTLLIKKIQKSAHILHRNIVVLNLGRVKK